jgi:hypothetical protein
MTLEINNPNTTNTWYGGYRVEFVQEAVQPWLNLEERLNEFIGYPNNEVTRAAIQAVLDRWNFENNDNVILDDLNLQ